MADAGSTPVHHAHPTTGDHAAVAIDPVCGMKVDPETSKHRFDPAGRTVHLCCAGCKEKVAADPAAWLKPDPAPRPPPPEGTIFTCPMHPEVRQEGPGACPLCGMALEPLAVTAEAAPNHELIDMTRRFW